MAELAALLYILEANRTPRAILRLYNIAFKHAHYCVEVLFPPKHLSVGVLFGLYYHKLTVHAAEDTRIVSSYTRLTENDERQFKELRSLATMTTRRSEDVARQLFEQIQMKGLMSSTPSAFNKENAQLSARAAKLTCMAEDTTFTEKFIKSQASFQEFGGSAREAVYDSVMVQAAQINIFKDLLWSASEAQQFRMNCLAQRPAGKSAWMEMLNCPYNS